MAPSDKSRSHRARSGRVRQAFIERPKTQVFRKAGSRNMALGLDYSPESTHSAWAKGLPRLKRRP